RPEDFDDLSFRVDVTRLPRLETNDDFVAWSWHRQLAFGDLDLNVVDDARIVRHDVEKVFRLLQGADNRIVRAFENANHPAFRAIASALRAGIRHIAGDPGHDFIAIH